MRHLLSWYYVYSLSNADDSDRAIWAERVSELGIDVAPSLVALLQSSDVRLCANGEAGLSGLAKRLGPDSIGTELVAQQLSEKLDAFSTPGREAALEWYLVILHEVKQGNAAPIVLTEAANKVLTASAKIRESGLRLRVLALAEVLLGRGATPHVELCHELAVQGMASQEAELRARAVRLVMHAPLHKEKPLLDGAVRFLKDPAPEVRRAAVLTIGLAEEAVAVQEMLPLLHDSDDEVRRLCEVALRGRGLLRCAHQAGQVDFRRPARSASTRRAAPQRLGRP